MINEDKAISISISNKKTYINPYVNETKENCGKFFLTSQEECRKSALEMAEWKDQQFKEYLEKKKEGLFNSNCLSVEPYIDFIDEIINELFSASEEYDNSDNDE